MTQTVRMSGPTLKVLKLLVEGNGRALSGAEISKVTKIGSGTLYPLLQRLEIADWLSSDWEQVDAALVGRPRRRFYRLTNEGQRLARKELAALQPSGASVGGLSWI